MYMYMYIGHSTSRLVYCASCMHVHVHVYCTPVQSHMYYLYCFTVWDHLCTSFMHDLHVVPVMLDGLCTCRMFVYMCMYSTF